MFKKKVIEEPIKKPEYIRKSKYIIYFDVRLVYEDKTILDIGRSFDFKEKEDAEKSLISLKNDYLIDANGIFFFFLEPENASILFVDAWIEEKFYYVEAGVA
jgi:hypothetical protein